LVANDIDENKDKNIWDEVLTRLRGAVDAEAFRRWFGPTSYASDAGDQITVWVPSDFDRRHLTNHFQSQIERVLGQMGRPGTHIRFVAAGVGDDEEGYRT
jgi:chromosomal replication initiation ATPase DnaA